MKKLSWTAKRIFIGQPGERSKLTKVQAELVGADLQDALL